MSANTVTNDQRQQVAVERRRHLPAEEVEVRRVDRARWRIVRKPLHADEQPVEEELRCQRRHRQVQALDAQARDAEQDADQRRHAAAEQDRDQQRQPRYPQREVIGSVGADRHERTSAERDLAAVADQNVEADRRQRQDQVRDQQRLVDVVVAERADLEQGQQRNADKGEQQDCIKSDPVLADREDRHVGGVGGLELTVLAVEHGRQAPKGRGEW